MKPKQWRDTHTHPLSTLILNIVINTAEHIDILFPLHCVDIHVIDRIVKKELVESSQKTLTYVPYTGLNSKQAFERYVRSLTNTLRGFQIHQE